MKKGLKDTVREAIQPTVTELGYRIWDVTYTKQGADYHLEITIDSDEGISINDCEKVHRAIHPILAEVDPTEDFYYIEVSSPGVERELRTEEHIMLSIGLAVEAKLFVARAGSKSVLGTLTAYEDKKITIETETESIVLDRSEISKLTTVYFDDDE